MKAKRKFLSFFPWQGRMALFMLFVAILFNLIHYSIFGDYRYIFEFILAQLGFLPISVYLVTVVLNRLMGRRERATLLKKLNMVVGSFFSEVGTDLLRHLSTTSAAPNLSQAMLVDQSWNAAAYNKARKGVGQFAGILTYQDINWQALKDFITAKKGFLLSLLGNANLMEHDSFTELLWAVFHLEDELASRRDIGHTSPADCEHLVGDANRVYLLLLNEWLNHMEHLQNEYPFLFSLEVRLNPFNPNAKAEIQG